MSITLRVIITIICIAVLLFGVGYWGFHVEPKPYDPFPGSTPNLSTVPLPSGLPAPVERFYRTTVGDRIPVIETGASSLHGEMRMFGLRLPLRLRAVQQVGQGYYQIIEPTFFGRPMVTWLDTFWNGSAHVDMPPGIPDNDPKMNQASNLAMWAACTPTIFLTDPRVRWEPIDQTHARLVVPAPAGTDSFTVAFNAQTGLMQYMEALRWKDRADAAQRMWRFTFLEWERSGGLLLPTTYSATWEGEQPWMQVHKDESLYNVDIQPFITAHSR
ncbi:MAG TPA: DUF6544 family protein [Symbiobacteriaceae bacterium]|nr:DUF6544 family protein [Symbiobacteriaceae bacterium]